ncbi:MAG: hypothetical protein DME69_10165 [Verrucomicrobia bacterium]|nr:MAG: hypothetical protein DME69_10165 [Verrucomicrobiota bacterium]
MHIMDEEAFPPRLLPVALLGPRRWQAGARPRIFLSCDMASFNRVLAARQKAKRPTPLKTTEPTSRSKIV